MFTGIVEGMGEMVSLQRRGDDLRITVRPPFPADELALGDSISVDGACLTAAAIEGGGFTADVSAETLSVTTLGGLSVGDMVNLERALTLSSRLGGHLVTGHVDCIGRLTARRPHGKSVLLTFDLPAGTGRYLIVKGSVAVAGVSLTVNRCTGTSFEVNVIPHTLKMTNLGLLNVGSPVNIEADLIGKYVEKFVRRAQGEGKLDEDYLKKHGF